MHYSHVEMAGYRSLAGVDAVESGVPRGAAGRLPVHGRAGRRPRDGRGTAPGAETSGAYTSTLTLEFDDGRVLRLDGSGNVLSDEPAPPES